VNGFTAGITVTVLRQSEDKWGNWTTTDTVTVGPCAIDYAGSTEQTAQVETLTRQAVLYPPADAEFRSTDFVLLPDGSRWSVVGAPADFTQPWSGWHPGQTVRLEAVTG
jgi:hypothetical protein